MKVIEIRKQPDLFYIYWTLTDFCNFKCNYCPSHLHSGDYHNGRKRGYPTDDQINTFLDLLISDYLPGKRLNLSLGGGEPTLHPMFSTIVEKMSPFGEVNVTTNGGRGVDWWAALPKLPPRITISLHHEFTSLNKINEISHFLVDAGVDLSYNLSCDPGSWSDAVSMYTGLDDDLKSLVQPKVLNYLRGDRSTYPYTEEQLVWIKNIQRKFVRSPKSIFPKMQVLPTLVYDSGHTSSLGNLADLTLRNNHIYTGWECSAGQETFNIHFDGIVYSSICKQVKIGRLENFQALSAPFICQTAACVCPGDLLVSKKKI
jgi:hypothetical protein